MIDYIREQGTINPSADGNWSFAPIADKAKITFETSPIARNHLKNLTGITYLETLKTGFAKYRIDLSKPASGPKMKRHSDIIYTVKAGDTLSHIGQRFGISWRKLAEYNKLANPHRIRVGQQIRIPNGGATRASK
ncbi:LysM peptidoglycan-binding domain-containing protein [Paenibacillus alkaliterrae]|uniref:LysM peptidoglycan-binding domain-containing protein n=1 Tax=Paenibacillus alkaliterrae TaxID=320909 RepID=UPI001F33DD9B|nr:LysM domain-containing protein [Paenibacillus alkaliterrae]MCF2940791.1 LysM peptidoglycan-binding domain-containing protein [Paenibacillus alkaliterrae]